MTGKISEKELSPKLNDRLTQQSKRLDNVENEFLENYKDVSLEHGLNLVTLEKGAGLPSLSIKGRTVINHAPLFDNGAWVIGIATVESPTKLRLDAETDYSHSYIDLPAKPNEQYTLNFFSNNGMSRIDYFDAEGNNLGYRGYLRPPVTVSTPEKTVKIRLFLGNGNQGAGTYTFENVSFVIGNEPKEFVRSFKPVRTPLIESRSKNLLPPLNEWVINEEAKVLDLYELELNATATGKYSYAEVSVVPNTTYTISGLKTGADSRIQVRTLDRSNVLANISTDNMAVFDSGNNARLRVELTHVSAGSFTFSNFQLEIGFQATEFEPQKKSKMYYPDLTLASSEDGSVYDELLPSGEVMKRFEDKVLDGNYTYSIRNATAFPNFKEINLNINNLDGITPYTMDFIVSKFNGRFLKVLSTSDPVYKTEGDQCAVGGTYLILTIPNQDTGWGDSYSPTADEVKAYFNGWKMFPAGGNRKDSYNATGSKSWCRITRLNDTQSLTGDTTAGALPTEPAGRDTLGNVYTPYKLQYQLVEPRIERANPVGRIQLYKGNNQIEVFEGFISKEKVVVKISSTNRGHINNGSSPSVGSPLKHKVDKFIKIYKNNEEDTFNWTFANDEEATNGTRAFSKPDVIDPTATYYVDYIALRSVFSADIAEGSLQLPISLASQVEKLVNILSDESIGKDRELYSRVDEFFTSVSSGKQQLETAITDKGGRVSKNRDIPTFNELEESIGTIDGKAKSFYEQNVYYSYALTPCTSTNILGAGSTVDRFPTLQENIYSTIASNQDLLLYKNDRRYIRLRELVLFSFSGFNYGGVRFIGNDRIIGYQKDIGKFTLFDFNGAIIKSINESIILNNIPDTNRTVLDFTVGRDGKLIALACSDFSNGSDVRVVLVNESGVKRLDSVNTVNGIDYRSAFYVAGSFIDNRSFAIAVSRREKSTDSDFTLCTIIYGFENDAGNWITVTSKELSTRDLIGYWIRSVGTSPFRRADN